MTNDRRIKSHASPRRARLTPVMIVMLAILILYSLSLIALLGWGLFTSLKTRLEFRSNPFGLPHGWPWQWEWRNYLVALQNFVVQVEWGAGFRYVFLEEMLLYTLLYAVGCSVVQTMACCIVAYLSERYSDWLISKVLVAIVIVTMILPIVGSLPSEIQMARTLGLYNHIWGMYIMKCNFLGMYFLVFRAMFKGIPRDFSDAARVDGAGNFTILFRITMPLIKSTLFTVMLLHFIGYWNDYQVPLIFIKSFPTLAYGLYTFNFSHQGSLSTVPMKVTGCMVLMIPILIVFLVFRNRLIGNISMGGLKE